MQSNAMLQSNSSEVNAKQFERSRFDRNRICKLKETWLFIKWEKNEIAIKTIRKKNYCFFKNNEMKFKKIQGKSREMKMS